MDNQWKYEKCETCDFRIEGRCRKFPPALETPRKYTVMETGSYVTEALYDYPEVGMLTNACSCWRWREKQ